MEIIDRLRRSRKRDEQIEKVGFEYVCWECKTEFETPYFSVLIRCPECGSYKVHEPTKTNT